MFFPKKFNSLEIARKIIKNTGLDENLGIIKQKKQLGTAEPRELLVLVMALSTCNLVQTMKSDFIVRGITDQNRDLIIRDYVLESLASQDLVKLGGAKDKEELRLAVMGIVAELEVFWTAGVDPGDSGPGPRYYSVKEVLKRLGGQPNYDLHDALFELMYLQYKHYLKFFREHLGQPE